MLGFIVGLIIGGMAGFMVACLCASAGMADREMERMQEKQTEKKEEYKCTNNMNFCGDICCKFCLGATDCKYTCWGNPEECKSAVKK